MRKSFFNEAHRLPEPKVLALAWSRRAELSRIIAIPVWLGVAFCAAAAPETADKPDSVRAMVFSFAIVVNYQYILFSLGDVTV